MGPKRTPGRVHSAIAGGVMLLCLGLLIWWLWPLRVLLFEVGALVGMALGFRYWPPMMRWVAGMPVPHRVVFGLILAAMLAGHFSFDNRKFFPLMSWEIFSNTREVDPVACRELIAVTEKGEKTRLLVEQLFPSIIQFNLPDDTNAKGMTGLVQALAKEYNRRHPAEPVRRVDLVDMAVRLHPSSREDFPACTLLKSYDVSRPR